MTGPADPDPVNSGRQIRTHMPFQQVAKLIHSHATIASQNPPVTVRRERIVQGVASFMTAPTEPW